MNHKRPMCCLYCMCPYWIYCSKWFGYSEIKKPRTEDIPYDNNSFEDDLDSSINDEYEETFNEEYIHNSYMIDIDPELFRIRG